MLQSELKTCQQLQQQQAAQYESAIAVLQADVAALRDRLDDSQQHTRSAVDHLRSSTAQQLEKQAQETEEQLQVRAQSATHQQQLTCCYRLSACLMLRVTQSSACNSEVAHVVLLKGIMQVTSLRNYLPAAVVELQPNMLASARCFLHHVCCCCTVSTAGTRVTTGPAAARCGGKVNFSR